MSGYNKERYQADPIYRARMLECWTAFRNSTKGKRAAKQKKEASIARKKPLLAEAKAKGCKLCGEREAACLDMHHVRDKEFTIGLSVHTTISAAKFKAELDKCVCLCANCHRKVHAGLVEL